MVKKKRYQIGVMGSAGTICSKKAYKLAYEVGKEVAKAGHIVVTGGGGGVMEAASKGASDNKGLVVGILPTDEKEDANKYVDVVIPTGIGFARNLMNINSSHGIIVVEGGVGTMTEVGYAYNTRTPAVALVGSGGTADKLAGRELDSRDLERIEPAFSPKESVSHLLKLIKQNKSKLTGKEVMRQETENWK